MRQLVIESNSPADTSHVGRILANVLCPGTTVSLKGTLGAGKTLLVKALAVERGAEPDEVTSPTFVMLQSYRGGVHHLDAYRVADDDEFLELGVDELFQSPSITLVEWGDRVSGCLPEDRLEIEIAVVDENARSIVIRDVSGKHAQVLDTVRQSWNMRATQNAKRTSSRE